VDGNQALSLATQMLPEIMVCDMMMPGRDGLSVCRELRKQAATRSQPFLMLTARADEETKLQALAAGASDFLPKPFSSQELRLRLKNLVDSHQLQKELSWQNRRLETALEQLKETETQLVQTEKLASLGRLCAGIIHEINNPLNYALGAMVLIRRAAPQLPADEQADFKESVADAEDGLKRVSNIVADLRSFTHSHGGPVEAISARETLNRLPRLFAAELNERVKLSLDVPDGLSVRANANQLLQVLINLIQNSLDALKARPADAPPGEVRVRAGLAGAVPFISVRDNGPGIPADLLSRIFDPFFTTKAVGSGMGLGLSICYRIMEESGGRIRVNSRPGEFCEFVLEFAADSQV
jgi:C4-dicarboxylate-specific signal transduction histidine kinase